MDSSTKKILAEVDQLKALGQTMVDRATQLEKLLAGEGKKPVSTRKGHVNKLAAQALANRNRLIAKR